MATPPEQVGPYRVISQIGRGGMAVVYLARQPALGRSVALKELAPVLAGDPALAQRFIREARVAGSLNHPNVVTVFDFLEQDGVPYIAMEYLERGSLRPFVGRMSLPQVAGVLEGLLAALSHAEAMGIVHRDVKPENLLITSDGGIKIADFGIAKAVQQVATEEMLTPAGATVGTPAYMAPEQAMAQEIGPWTDLYQTGVVAFELLAGAVPFQTQGSPIAVLMKHISDPVPPLPAGTDPALAAWVTRLMAKDPADRPRHARAAWNELEEIVVEVEGPLWRRDARLGEHEPTVEHPPALTPARFSSWQDYVAEPTPRPAATTPPPPPPPPAESVAPEPPVADAAPSGYVEFDPEPREAERAPEPTEAVSPPEPERPAPEPPAEAVVPLEPERPAPEPPAEAVVPTEPERPAPEPPAEAVVPPAAVTPEPSVAVTRELAAPTIAPRSRPAEPERPPRRRPWVLPLGAGALLVAVVVAVVVFSGGGDEPTPTPTPTPTATATATPTTTEPPAGPFAVGEGPDGIAFGENAIWAVASRGGTLARIDPATGDITTVDVGENPDSVVVAFGSVWVSVTGEDKVVRTTAGAQPEVIAEFDVGSRPEGLEASSRAIWVANAGDRSVSQIIEATGEVRSVQNVGGEPVDLAIGAGAVWVADASDSSIARVDGGRGGLASTVFGVGRTPRAVTILGRDVWVASAGDGRAWRIDGDANRVTGSVRVGGTPRDIVTDGEHLFVADRDGDRVVEIDPEAMAVVNRETVEGGPLSLAVDERDIFVTRFDSGDVARIVR